MRIQTGITKTRKKQQGKVNNKTQKMVVKSKTSAELNHKNITTIARREFFKSLLH
jgi:hypothetical protein